MASLRCVYCDLDGTLLGAGGSLVHDHDGGVSLLGVRAVEACHRADVELVLFSGRRKAQVAEPARLLGCRAYIYEAGSALVLDGEDRCSSRRAGGSVQSIAGLMYTETCGTLRSNEDLRYAPGSAILGVASVRVHRDLARWLAR